MATRCLVILQNAWSPLYAGDIWPRESWLKALHACPTGRALRVIFPDQTGIEFDNTTAEVSEEPNGICEPDPSHITSSIDRKASLHTSSRLANDADPLLASNPRLPSRRSILSG
jgi:hypothetical protein